MQGFTGLGLSLYGPVSGNWCWITKEHLILRYALTHGWRILIFISTTLIYTIIYIKLRRVFGSFRAINRTTTIQAEQRDHELRDSGSFSCSTEYEGDLTRQQREDLLEDKALQPDPRHVIIATPFVFSDGVAARPHRTNLPGHQDINKGDIKRMLMLNGYPILYLVLWIPGILNRLLEATGHAPLFLTALQSSTQFVGLANALTYGYNEGLKARAQEWWRKRKSYTRTID